MKIFYQVVDSTKAIFYQIYRLLNTCLQLINGAVHLIGAIGTLNFDTASEIAQGVAALALSAVNQLLTTALIIVSFVTRPIASLFCANTKAENEKRQYEEAKKLADRTYNVDKQTGIATVNLEAYNELTQRRYELR